MRGRAIFKDKRDKLGKNKERNRELVKGREKTKRFSEKETDKRVSEKETDHANTQTMEERLV